MSELEQSQQPDPAGGAGGLPQATVSLCVGEHSVQCSAAEPLDEVYRVAMEAFERTRDPDALRPRGATGFVMSEPSTVLPAELTLSTRVGGDGP